MKIIKVDDCLKCENLIFDESWDAYVCKLEPDEKNLNKYVAELKWLMDGDSTPRRCLLG